MYFLLLFSHPVVNCTDPGIPANSIRESKIEHGNFTFGSVVFYDCNPGYYLFGSSVLTCQPVGHWDRPLPECIGTVVASFNCYVTCPHFSALSYPPFCVIDMLNKRNNQEKSFTLSCMSTTLIVSSFASRV